MYILTETQNNLIEAEKTRDFMSQSEKILKKKLINLLKDDGKGHHHAKYAAVLEKFIVQIVPLGKEPSTAAISFDEGIIYINQGFLRDPETFWQLNVIIRHELCHNLLMHQIRMIKYLKNTIPELNLRTSMSIHELLNIIEDFEISNKKYTAEDKDTVRHTWLNGKIISGLVTEDHRKSWEKMSLEEMYDAILKEMEDAGWTGNLKSSEDSMTLKSTAMRLHSYKDTSGTSEFKDLQDFHEHIFKAIKRGSGRDAEMPENWESIFKGLQKILDDPVNGYNTNDIDKMIKEIADSKPIGAHDIVSPVTGEIFVTVYTPEERSIAIECLKIIKGDTSYQDDYDAWYKEIMRKLKDSNYTDDQIRDLLKCCH